MKEEKDVRMNRSVGFVCKLRLPPYVVMAALDCIATADQPMPGGASLSAAMKRGIAIAFNTLISAKVIPERDGFEYRDMIAPYYVPNQKEKIVVGHGLVIAQQREEEADEPRIAITPRQPQAVRTPDHDAKDNTRARITRRRVELLFKQDNDPLNFTEEEAAELTRTAADLAALDGTAKKKRK